MVSKLAKKIIKDTAAGYRNYLLSKSSDGFEVDWMKESGRAIEKYQPLWGFWKVDKLIGQGVDCEIYSVYKEEWGKRYISTVKFMSFSVSKNDISEAQAIGIDRAAMPEYFKSLLANVQNEIELMYKLRGNSNIVTYEDHGIYEKKGNSGWDVLIRMEYLQALPDFLMGRELERLEAVRLGIDICKALEACVKENIIHRDIKDSNIFVSPRGEFKLGSFSMAKELSKGGRTVLTALNPLYMAPELYKEQAYDFSVDLYSLGMVMYKLLNKGRLPFLPLPPEAITVDDTERSVARRMSGEKLALPADAGESLGTIILKACSYDRRDRYKSPAEFRQKLERLLKAEAKIAAGCQVVRITADKEDAGISKKNAEELERAAVVEIAASINSASGLSKKKLFSVIAMVAAVMIMIFVFAYTVSYDAIPVTEEPAAGEIAETVGASPPPEAAEVLNPVSTVEEIKKDSQIKKSEKGKEIQKLRMKASEYYEKHEYEKAIGVFSELIKLDASYSSFAQYSDSFVQLAREHNLAGVKHYNEGSLEQAIGEFDDAAGKLEAMKANTRDYDLQLYSSLKELFAENKDKMLEKTEKINECFELAEECNMNGVRYYNEGSFKNAKLEFENAIKHLEEIRLLVPKYSGNSYEDMMEMYKGNLSRAEERS
ncbi:MAG: protein kinase [Clostridiaceae bacterium]|nr:protein kinase [Clostridiaceae bacterium]